MKDIKKVNDIVIGCLCALTCETIFGLSYIFTKRATEVASAFTVLGWRFLLAFVVMALCAAAGLININLKGKRLYQIIAVALFNPFIYFIGETLGIDYTTASESGAFLACIPIASLAASALILRKKPERKQVIGICVTFTGMMITIFYAGSRASFSAVGYIMLFAAIVSYALYCVFVEKAEDFTGTEITFIMILAGAVIFVILAISEAVVKDEVAYILTLPFKDGIFLSAILYQGICSSVIAFFMSNIAILKIGVNRTASFIGISTVVSIIAGMIFLKENFAEWQIIGAIFIILGVYIANMKKSDKIRDI